MIIELTLQNSNGTPITLHLTSNFVVVPSGSGSKILDGLRPNEVLSHSGWNVMESYSEVTSLLRNEQVTTDPEQVTNEPEPEQVTNEPEQGRREIRRNALFQRLSGHFLSEHLPENWHEMSDEQLSDFIEENTWGPLERCSVDEIFELIDALVEDVMQIGGHYFYNEEKRGEKKNDE